MNTPHSDRPITTHGSDDDPLGAIQSLAHQVFVDTVCHRCGDDTEPQTEPHTTDNPETSG